MEWGVRREQQRGEVYPVCLSVCLSVCLPCLAVPSFINLYQATHTLSCMCIAVAASSSSSSRRTCSSRAITCQTLHRHAWRVRAQRLWLVVRCAITRHRGTNRNIKSTVLLCCVASPRLPTANQRQGLHRRRRRCCSTRAGKLVIRRHEAMTVPRKIASLVAHNVDCTCMESRDCQESRSEAQTRGRLWKGYHGPADGRAQAGVFA